MKLNLSSIRYDITGGLTAGIIALPLALAFGIASGLGASAGLYGAIFLGFFAALFGGTKMQVSGPTGPMTVAIAGIVAIIDPANALGVLVTIFILAGLLQILLGLLRVGSLIQFMPHSVISGFISGIGVIIIIIQISPLLGGASEADTLYVLLNINDILLDINWYSAAIGFSTLALLYLIPEKFTRILPSALIALILMSFLCYLLPFDIARIDGVPTGLPSLVLPEFDLKNTALIIYGAFTLAILGGIDSLLTSVVADSITKTKHNSNQELIGQGIGNAIAGLFGGIPGAGATMRTVVNIQSGGTSRLSGMVHAVFLALVLLCFAPIVSYVPIPVLAGILVRVGIDILDYKVLRSIRHIYKKDLVIMIVVFLLTVFVNLIFAVAFGVLLASFMLVYRIAFALDIQKHKESDEIKVITLKGFLFFANSAKLLRFCEEVADAKYIIIDCQKLSIIDLTAFYAIEEVMEKLSNNKIYLLFNPNTPQKELANSKKLLQTAIYLDKNYLLDEIKNDKA